MANVFDVAAYILERIGPMSTWKLQKLVYYSQAWSLVWDDDQLFPEECRAWVNGPVVRELYDIHRGRLHVESLDRGDPSNLSACQRETIDSVLEFYGDKAPRWLSELTHIEDPWKNARVGIPEDQRSNVVIPKQDMAEYYGGLFPDKHR